jgi:hypothetical protein
VAEAKAAEMHPTPRQAQRGVEAETPRQAQRGVDSSEGTPPRARLSAGHPAPHSTDPAPVEAAHPAPGSARPPRAAVARHRSTSEGPRCEVPKREDSRGRDTRGDADFDADDDEVSMPAAVKDQLAAALTTPRRPKCPKCLRRVTISPESGLALCGCTETEK